MKSGNIGFLACGFGILSECDCANTSFDPKLFRHPQ